MTVYRRNLHCLCAKFPGFKKDILDNYTPKENLEKLDTPSGSPTAILDGLYLHSRNDPVNEGHRIVEQSITGEEDCVVLEGFGLGYLAEAVLRKAPTMPLIIVESDPSLFLALLSVRPLDQIFSRDNVSLLLAVEGDNLVRLVSSAGYADIKVIRHRLLSKLYEQYFDSVEKALAAYLARKDINRNTLKRFAGVWVRNLMSNLPVMARARGTAALKDRFQGLPALLLAAGPTVEEVLPFLKELRKRFILISVDTCAGLLSAAGIEPDILVVVDPQYWNTRYLDTAAFRESLLISESSTHPRVFRLLKGPVFFGSSIFPLGRYLERFTAITGELGAGGSVATSAWDLARWGGCKEIICAGLDLGFPEMKTHYRGCFFEHLQLAAGTRLVPTELEAYKALHSADPFYEPSLGGERVLTDHRLKVYKWWFENQFRTYSQVTTRSLSLQGLYLEGLGQASMEELLSYPQCREEIDRRVREIQLTAAPAGKTPDDLTRGIRKLREALEDLEQAANKGLSTLTEIHEKRDRGKDFSRELELLDALDREILSSETKDLAGFLMQDFISMITSRKEDPEGKGRTDALVSTRILYEGLKEALEYHLDLLNRTVQKRSEVTGGLQ
ncbi:MAG: motility associated factor glycosyltransferase family protein [Spirochaetales bacterium]|nr:motility associated factor glycosyltransferase family protein [Spirochaetales bacterium]